MKSSSDTAEPLDRKSLPNQSPRKIKKRVLKPLAASTYLLRNAGKTIPLTTVIILAVTLVTGIIAMIDSIPYSIRVVYRYAKEETGIAPRGDPALLPQIVETVRKQSPVPIERISICRVSSSLVKSIVGKWPFMMLGLGQEDMRYYARRQGMTSLTGRYPAPGAPEAMISRPVAKNLNLHIGSIILKPDDLENYAPEPVKVVGIGETDRWFMVNSIEFQRANYFPPVDDALNVVIGVLALVITFMMGMLMNIYQSQRLVEFGLLQAIGYTKKQLLRRVLMESVSVIMLGWALGLVLTFLLLKLAAAVMLEPRAFALDVFDRQAYAYTIPIPFAILVVATLTVVLRFRKFDPVGVVERRLV